MLLRRNIRRQRQRCASSDALWFPLWYSERGYRRYAALYLGDWLSRSLDTITRRNAKSRFWLLTERHGEMPANHCLSFPALGIPKAVRGLRGSSEPGGAVAFGRGLTTARGARGSRRRSAISCAWTRACSGLTRGCGGERSWRSSGSAWTRAKVCAGGGDQDRSAAGAAGDAAARTGPGAAAGGGDGRAGRASRVGVPFAVERIGACGGASDAL